jgi:hypothetical protein
MFGCVIEDNLSLLMGERDFSGIGCGRDKEENNKNAY